MIVIAVAAVICCGDSWSDVANFGNAKRKWFQTFVDLSHGIPCQDAFERCFMYLAEVLMGASRGRLIAIDGKKIRRSFCARLGPIDGGHLVSAFRHENATVLGQLSVNCKENEIVAIPKLLEL